MKKHIIAVVIILVMIAALSVTAFADGPQMGGQAPQMGGQAPQMGSQGSQMGGTQQSGQMRGFHDRLPSGGQQAPDQQTAPDENGQAGFPADGERMRGRNGFDRQTTPDENGQADVPAGGGPMRGRNGFSRGNHQSRAMDQFMAAMNGIEDEEVKANLEGLMQSYLDALDAERKAEDDDARTEASEAVAAAKAALDEAFAAAGIDVSVSDGHREHGKQQSEGSAQPEAPSEPPVDEQPIDTMSDEEMFQLFQQFMDWMKNQE